MNSSNVNTWDGAFTFVCVVFGHRTKGVFWLSAQIYCLDPEKGEKT